MKTLAKQCLETNARLAIQTFCRINDFGNVNRANNFRKTSANCGSQVVRATAGAGCTLCCHCFASDAELKPKRMLAVALPTTKLKNLRQSAKQLPVSNSA